ncbi:MAG: hypothetical protein M9949_07030 [Candidatus Kapabacteria bacterium]|nr:hypothetical protein [Candidatus Kapabacteria bacterium]
MKSIITILFLFFTIHANILAIDGWYFYDLINLNTIHTTSLNNAHVSSKYNIGLHEEEKSSFTHVPDGTSYSRYVLSSKFGVAINNFSNEFDTRFICELMYIDFFSEIDIPIITDTIYGGFKDVTNYDKSIYYGGIKIINLNNDIFRKNDNEWIKLHFGSGFNLLNKDLDMIIPHVYMAVGYSTFKPEKRNSPDLLNFSDADFSGLDLELGAKFDIEYGNLDIKGSSCYRRILEINPDIEILQNHLKIGYSHYVIHKHPSIDSFGKYYYKTFSIYLTGNYDLLKVNSMIQKNPSLGIHMDLNLSFLLYSIETALDSNSE